MAKCGFTENAHTLIQKLFEMTNNTSRTTNCTKIFKHSLKASFQYFFGEYLAIFVALVFRQKFAFKENVGFLENLTKEVLP